MAVNPLCYYWECHVNHKNAIICQPIFAPYLGNNAICTQNPNPNQPTPQGTPPLKELVKQYDSVALLLQGGGALGAYQAGIYEGLHKQGIKIDRISGISNWRTQYRNYCRQPPRKPLGSTARVLEYDYPAQLHACWGQYVSPYLKWA